MAEDQYFLKRGDAVKGPFSLQKLQSLLAAKKLKANDLVGASNDGPWERLAAVHKTIRAGQPLELGTETAAKTEGTVSPPQQPQNPNLIECTDCGKAISKRAASCPHCGAPVEDSTAETASGDDEYGYGDDEYDYGNDEYGYEDDLSTPGDTYRPAARRKPKKKTKAIPEKAETENNRNSLYLIAGISVLGVCFLGGIGYFVAQVLSSAEPAQDAVAEQAQDAVAEQAIRTKAVNSRSAFNAICESLSVNLLTASSDWKGFQSPTTNTQYRIAKAIYDRSDDWHVSVSDKDYEGEEARLKLYISSRSGTSSLVVMYHRYYTFDMYYENGQWHVDKVTNHGEDKDASGRLDTDKELYSAMEDIMNNAVANPTFRHEEPWWKDNQFYSKHLGKDLNPNDIPKAN